MAGITKKEAIMARKKSGRKDKPNREMTFFVGPWGYRLRILAAVGERGNLLAQSFADLREIQMSRSVARANRLAVLLAELKSCWLFHVPRASTDEEECDLFATVSAAAFRDLGLQGGVAALEQLKPDPIVQPPLSIQIDNGIRPESGAA
jgi:hypothetical protein